MKALTQVLFVLFPWQVSDKMNKNFGIQYRPLSLVLLTIFLLQGYLSPPAALSETLVNKSNWKEVEGFLPDQIIEWIKNGEWIIHTADSLAYAPDGGLLSLTQPFFKETSKTNNGKFGVNNEGLLIDIKTDKPPAHIVGIPFPAIDPDDSQAGIKAIYNKYFYPLSFGNKLFDTSIITLGMSGIEKEMQVQLREFCITGLPSLKNTKNKKYIEKYSIAHIKKPFDMAGTAVMKWRYLNHRRDLDYVYIPAMHKVRRMSPTNNLDDLLRDDGKVSDYKWTLIGSAVTYVPFHSQEPIEMIPGDKRGEWKTNTKTGIKFGYTTKDWKGAPWCPLNPVWVKRKVLIIDAKSKNPGIKHGEQHIWIDAETFLPVYKFVKDQSQNPWKITILIGAYLANADRSFESVVATSQIVIDLKLKNSTIVNVMDVGQNFVFYASLNKSTFSLSGFQQFCR